METSYLLSIVMENQKLTGNFECQLELNFGFNYVFGGKVTTE